MKDITDCKSNVYESRLLLIDSFVSNLKEILRSKGIYMFDISFDTTKNKFILKEIKEFLN